MSKSTPASRVRSTYDFIKAQSTTHPVQALCRVLNVAVTSVKVVYDASSGLTDHAAFFLGPRVFCSACSSSRFSTVK